MAYETREKWLLEATQQLRPLFREQGANIPDIYVSVGWPKGSRGANHAIGQCWPKSADGTPAVFISPELPNAAHVLHVLVHELVHATVGCDAGHRGPFRKLALAVGLEGKMTSTHAGPDLAQRLHALGDTLGEYPHSALAPNAIKKQTTRMVKLECMAWDADDTGEGGCGMVIRTTRKWLETIGEPHCACGGRFARAD
jgi:hypothetical protein